jgi:hypothetical protein
MKAYMSDDSRPSLVLVRGKKEVGALCPFLRGGIDCSYMCPLLAEVYEEHGTVLIGYKLCNGSFIELHKKEK